MTSTYDWEGGRWPRIPLGVPLSRLVKIKKIPVQFNGQYEYDFADDEIGPESTIRLTLKLSSPRKRQLIVHFLVFALRLPSK